MGRLFAIILCLSALTVSAEVLSGYAERDSVEARMARLPLSPVEGIWEMAADGAVFAIERTEASDSEVLPRELRIVILRSPLRRVRPGSVMGTARPTVKPGVYEAWINTKISELGALTLPRKFTLTLNSEQNALTIQPFKSPVKVNLFRMIPYLYRVVRIQDSRPDGLDGAIRIYPPQPVNPLTPVYL
ncbi:MAG: hypothetical protein K2K82_02600 [Muribaculaceae bacterium]|nr:hypothetical protein [Muribaculaceae bacterium]